MKFSSIFAVALLQAPGLLASAVPASEGELFARDCWFGKEVGCHDKWCWKTCDAGSGTWVSLAFLTVQCPQDDQLLTQAVLDCR